MPRQNRVTPRGEIIATPARGDFMGKRGGCLHDASGKLGAARWRGNRWITCLLEFKGRRRTIMTPGRYTELFFLDEATALAAGHRPCRECRRPAFEDFKLAWLKGNPEHGLTPDASIDAIDAILQRERVSRDREQVTHRASIDSLPEGVFVVLDHSPAETFLLWDNRLQRWSPEGYKDAVEKPHGFSVQALTPRSTVRAIATGYRPAVHATADGSR
ncbi:MAG: hypothetical protein ACR2PL_11605 [Dehalococcoidia bacterium]